MKRVSALPPDPVIFPPRGREFFYEYFEPTDKLGADVPNPKSHIAYGYATHVAILDDDGKVKEIYAAHDSGKVVNPISIQGQIEGGVLMSMGYALTEDFPLENGVPKAKFGTLGLLRAPQIPEIHAIYVEKEELLPVAYGAKGIGEIAAIPTAPALRAPITRWTVCSGQSCRWKTPGTEKQSDRYLSVHSRHLRKQGDA